MRITITIIIALLLVGCGDSRTPVEPEPVCTGDLYASCTVAGFYALCEHAPWGDPTAQCTGPDAGVPFCPYAGDVPTCARWDAGPLP